MNSGPFSKLLMAYDASSQGFNSLDVVTIYWRKSCQCQRNFQGISQSCQKTSNGLFRNQFLRARHTYSLYRRIEFQCGRQPCTRYWYRTKYPRNLILAHLSVNSIRYKFYEISNILNGNCIDIFGISATKIDASFTSAQFRIPDFKMYRQDRDSKGNGGWLIVYIKDSIPHRQLNKYTGITSSIEHMSFEISFNKYKWFLVYVYKPPKISDECTLNVLSKFADELVGNSNVCVFFGDKNCDMFKDNILYDLCDIYDMKNIVTGATCFKNETPTLIDVFLTNKPNSFCRSINIDTGISDFHNLTGIISRAP